MLWGVSLHVTDGELLGLFGYNGAGKSTLLKTINGLVQLKSGVVRVHRRNLTNSNLRWIRMETAYVPQSIDVDPRMPVTALEVTLMGRYGAIGLLRRVGPKDIETAGRALELVDAAHLAARPFGQLSGGEQQRVYIARALAQDPRVLLLDEPTNSLDWKFQQRLGAIVRAVHEERKLTTIVVSHDVDLLACICDRIVLMQDGHVVGERKPSEFTQRCRSHSLFEQETGS
ncbi:MAG: ABC transporter ATP-binding protein [Armatimonadota bacterium]